MVIVLIPLLEILAALVAAALCVLAIPLANAIADWTSHILHRVPFVGGKVEDWAKALARWITHHLGAWFNAKARRITRWLGGLSHYAAVTAFWALAWPVELLRAVEWLEHRVIPDRIRATTAHTARQAKAAVQTVTKVVLPDMVAVRRYIRSLVASIPASVPIPVGKRLRELEKATVGLGAAALVWTALKRLGLGSLRCNNNKRLDKAMCGANPLLMDVLIAELGFVAGAFSIRELTRDLQKITPAVVDGLGYVIREAPSDFHDFDKDVLAAARALIPGA